MNGKAPGFEPMHFDAMYDMVVAGGGSAGCVMASRLTEAPDLSLCLIEAGPRDRNPWIHIPLGMGKLIPDPKMTWSYATQPEPALGSAAATLRAKQKAGLGVELGNHERGHLVDQAIDAGAAPL